jgi:ribose transport system ATP-binding protein
MPSTASREHTSAEQGVLTLNSVSKSFGHGIVLDSVSFQAMPGRVLGVVGENGAGKSTLLKLAAGLEQPDSGEMLFQGKPVKLASYSEANRLGISMVFQEQALIPQLTVYENLFLGLTTNFAVGPVLKRNQMRKKAQEIFSSLGIDDGIRVERALSEYSFGQRQLIEIARAFAVAEVVGADFPVILLDEATASLDGDERKVLFRLIEKVRKNAAIVFVSHILDEILALCDDLLILKDGQVVDRGPVGDYTLHKLHSLITGRAVPESLYQEEAQVGSNGEVIFESKALGLDGEFHDVSLQIRQGEIVGIAGVVGSGKESLGRVLAGLQKPSAGNIISSSPSLPGYVPKERLAEGIISGATVKNNASITPIARGAFQKGSVLNLKGEKTWAEQAVAKLNIRPGHISTRIDDLSGGNQQKVVMARWLTETPDVIILDNPTRGVDIGSKFSIYTLIRELTIKGVGIVLISDDLSETIGLSDRILALRDHKVVAELSAQPGKKPTETTLVAQLV